LLRVRILLAESDNPEYKGHAKRKRYLISVNTTAEEEADRSIPNISSQGEPNDYGMEKNDPTEISV